MSALTSREIRLQSRPEGLPQPDNFVLASVTLPAPGPGEVAVRNHYMSVDPYMRGRMRAGRSYVPPFQLGEALTGGAVGEVLESNHADFAPGDFVLSHWGWREAFVSNGQGLSKIDPSLTPIQAYLGVMGMPGMTAYVGLNRIAELKAGETLFVSGGAGAVGSVACQIGRIRGCRVVASAGSAGKVAWLREKAGVDAAINYKETDNLPHALAQACPDGLDVYFDNVGGDHLEAALAVLKPQGRVAVCGMIAQYNATEPSPAPRNLAQIIGKRLRLQGFIVSDHGDMQETFRREMADWIAQGKIHWEETTVTGIDRAPEAFIGLFTGMNLGKMLVKLI